MKPMISILTMILLAAPAVAGDWTQFRGTGGTASASDTGLPIRWTDKDNLRWKVDLPGRGLSNPVIAEGKVYVTACTGFQHSRLHVLCYDEATGRKLWERQLWSTGNTTCHPKTSMAAPTPATDGKRVYALFATCDLVCYDADGNLVWYRSLTRDYPTVTNQVGMAASPVLCNDMLILCLENAGESFAAGIDKLTGQNRWKIERNRLINWVTPLVFRNGDRDEVLFQSPNEITSYDPATGKKLWSFEGKGLSTTPSPVPAGGMILVTGGELIALKPGLGKTEPEVLWRQNRLRSATASPLFYRNRIYTLNSAGVLNCADSASGNVLWQERLKGPFSASPVAADGKIYAVNEAGVTFVVQLGEQPTVLGSNAINETVLATPAIANGAIYLRSDQHLYCISEKQPR